MDLNRTLSIIGAPSSAGAYAPGQEKAPDALRRVGLIATLASHGIAVEDCGNTTGFRWRADAMNPRAMNVDAVIGAASATACMVEQALRRESSVLVLGGDCTVELGTVAGSARIPGATGLIYMDLDCDLNTPGSTTDGALDWMGVAHLLALDGTLASLAGIGPRMPLLTSPDILLFANSNITDFERRVIQERQIRCIHADEVAADPETAAGRAIEWGSRFDRLLIHFDADTIDFESLPLAENTRRKAGLSFPQAMRALSGLLKAPNWRGLTIAEVNPDHGTDDGSTLAAFVDALAAGLSGASQVCRSDTA